MTKAFRQLLLEGLRKFARGGYVSEGDLQDWLTRLHAMLDRELPTDEESRDQLSRVLNGVFNREVRGLGRRIPDLERYTIDRVAPHLRAELDRRIYAGADLIRLHRKTAIDKTLQRFSGWVTSVPPTGASTTNLRELAKEIGKSVTQLKFEARRVAIDQGHKLSASVARTVAEQNGAIAGIWHDRGEHDASYDARPKHLARSGKVFLIRDSWAHRDGLVRKGAAGYTDEIDHPAELPFCSCFYEYITTPHELPDEMLTAAGRLWVHGKNARNDSVHPDRAAITVERSPSEGQIGAGNYRMGHLRMFGLEITIETAKGGMRRGIDADGKAWQVLMPAHYGYIKRTTGADGEHIDCYVGSNPFADTVYVIRQQNPDTGEFDELKVMLGFSARAQAISTYVRGFSDGRGHQRIQSVTEMSVQQFKDFAQASAA